MTLLMVAEKDWRLYEAEDRMPPAEVSRHAGVPLYRGVRNLGPAEGRGHCSGEGGQNLAHILLPLCIKNGLQAGVGRSCLTLPGAYQPLAPYCRGAESRHPRNTNSHGAYLIHYWQLILRLCTRD